MHFFQILFAHFWLSNFQPEKSACAKQITFRKSARQEDAECKHCKAFISFSSQLSFLNQAQAFLDNMSVIKNAMDQSNNNLGLIELKLLYDNHLFFAVLLTSSLCCIVGEREAPFWRLVLTWETRYFILLVLKYLTLISLSDLGFTRSCLKTSSSSSSLINKQFL